MENLCGQIIKDYELRERIGSGGFGAVYRAYQTTVGREVAIKIILPGFAGTPEFIRRFEMEAQVIARLEHPFIVPLYDYWRDPNGAYLVMRWLRGGSLREALADGPFDIEAAAHLLDQITSALVIAHRNDVIHRDIKPGNILLDEDSNAYLADFGIAKDLSPLKEGVTQPDAVVGSLDYLSPEQARGEPVTPRTDIYSLGVVLYEMLQGEHPFPGSNPLERLYKHISDVLPEMIQIDERTRRAVNDVVQKATAKNPDHRYPDALALAAAFREAAALDRPTLGENLVEQLTRREQEILRLVTAGCTNQQIAHDLFIELSTVKWYINQLYRKLGVRSRMQAIVRARELNLVVDTGEWERGEAGAVSTVVSLPEPENPYKGLRAFEPADHRDFFGREELIQSLLARMTEKHKFSRFLVVAGPSGSGKSSLVKAGLIPALWRGDLPGSERWFVVEVLPGAHPLDKLEVALMRVAANQSANIHEHLTRDERGLLRTADLILPDDGSELVLLIDQFEEVFTLVEDETIRQQFLDLLRAAVTAPRSRVRVVATLRADFYDRPLHYPEFGELVRSRMETVLPLTAKGLERAIAGPAERVGVVFEEGLVAQIVSEMTYQSGALPLLQYALTELFEHREGRLLTHRAYQEIGGAVGALATRAEAVYDEMNPDAQESARQMFLRLVTLGEGVEDTRRRVARSELLAIADGQGAVMDDLIDMYAEYRLLTLDHDPGTRSPTVEVAHEAVLREWERLRNWLDENRSDIRMQRQLAAAAAEWYTANRDASYCLRGRRLEQLEGWAAETELALTESERAYLEASIAERERQTELERQQQAREAGLKQRAQRVLQALMAVFLAAAVISGGLALWANSQRSRAETAREAEAEARAGAQHQAAILLAAQAESEVESGFYDRAVLLALEALENYSYTPQAEHALGQAVSYNRALQQYTGHTSAVTSVDWSPDGTRVASSGTDNTVHVWDAETGEALLVINLPTGITGNMIDWGLTVKWSPGGEHLLTVSGDRYLLGSQDYDLTLWDAVTGEQITTVEISNRAEPAAGEGMSTSSEHYTTGAAAAFAPSSGRLATVGGDNTALIWDAALKRQELVLTGHEDAVNGVDWSPDGMSLATASEDGTARIWDAQSGEERLVLTGHEGAVNQAIWSPDGTQLATAGKDGMVRLWDAQTGEMVQTIEPGVGIVWSLTWSPDGSLLVTGTNDARIRLWEINSGKVVAELNGHAKFVTYLAWSAVDNRLVSAGADGIARIWNAAPSTAILTLPYGYVAGLSWSSDGRSLAVATGDGFYGTEPGSLAVWDIYAGQPVVEELDTQFDYYWLQSTFSPDDRLLLGRGAPLWPDILPAAAVLYALDARTGEIIRTFTVDEEDSFVRTGAWSPDGTQVAAGMALTGTLAVWDFETGELLLKAISCGGAVADWIVEVEWSPDGTKIAAVCGSQSITDWPYWVSVWDAATFDLLFTLPDPNPPAGYLSVTWSPDGTRILTTGGSEELGTQDNPVRIWDGNTGEEQLTILWHTGQVISGSWSPDGSRVVTGSADGTTRLWDATTGAELLTLSTPNHWGAVPEWSPKGDLLAVGVSSLNAPGRTEVWRVWQSTEELIAYAKECCIWRKLTPQERQQFGLPPRES